MAVCGVLGAALVTIALYLPHIRTAGFVYQDAYAVSPVVVHSLSLALHLLNGLLIFTIARRLLWPAPAWIAAIFLIHPLNIEAVAYGAAQSELIILGSVLLSVWALLNRWWLAVGLPVFALSTTKAHVFVHVIRHPDVAGSIAQGVSYLSWWRWEASAAVGHLARWIVPIGLSNDHDVVHLGRLWQTLALIGLPSALLVVAWLGKREWPVLVAVAWITVVLLPRFAARVPLSILNEHHWYPVTVGLSLLTVTGLSKLGVVR